MHFISSVVACVYYVLLFRFVGLCIFPIPFIFIAVCRVIEDHGRNDLNWVCRGVKLYSLNHPSVYQIIIAMDLLHYHCNRTIILLAATCFI